MAVGAIMIGIDIFKSNTVVVKSILLTSTRIRGWNLFEVNQIDVVRLEIKPPNYHYFANFITQFFFSTHFTIIFFNFHAFY